MFVYCAHVALVMMTGETVQQEESSPLLETDGENTRNTLKPKLYAGAILFYLAFGLALPSAEIVIGKLDAYIDRE